MPKVTFVEANGHTNVVEATEGESLMRAAVGAGVSGIVAECGGAMACGTCHCYVVDGPTDRLPPVSADERDMLDFVIDPQDTSRLSCQIVVTKSVDGLVVEVPATQT